MKEKDAGATLKTPEQSARDTKKVRFVRFGIALASLLIVVLVAFVVSQFIFSQV